jgi:hypothetical protein
MDGGVDVALRTPGGPGDPELTGAVANGSAAPTSWSVGAPTGVTFGARLGVRTWCFGR